MNGVKLSRLCSAVVFGLGWGIALAQTPLGTGFTYQGQLKRNGSPLNGTADFIFRLWDDPASINPANQVGVPQVVNAAPISDGLFTVQLNAAGEFGSNVFNGEARWLEITVNAVVLSPRQELTSTPNALFALSASTAANATQLNGQQATFYQDATNLSSGTLADARLSGSVALLNNAQTFSEAKAFSAAPSFTAAGAPFSVSSTTKVTNLNADLLDGLNSSAFLQSIPVPLLLSGTNSSQIIRGQNASSAQDSVGIRGISTSSSGRTYGIYGVSDSPDGAGVRGQATSTADGASFGGYFSSASPRGYGVYGIAGNPGSGYTSGVYGISYSTKGSGVSGVALAASDFTTGVSGRSDSTEGHGVFGWATADSGANYGGYFQSDSSTGTGVYGFATATSGVAYGVYGESDSTSGRGVCGEATAASGSTYGGRFESDSTSGRGVHGSATAATGSTYGGYFESQSTNGFGLYGRASATSGTIYGVRGVASTVAGGYAVYAAGDMGASGVKPFRIDHPDDPANKYLLHYSVESPEVLNMYSGRVTLDGAGQAVVALPHYFAKINKDPRYTLTAVGAAMPMLHVAEEINLTAPSSVDEATPKLVAPACYFRIAGGVPGGKVSWEVKALRNDARMRLHGAPVERDKTGRERGRYEHPEYYGQPPEMSVDYDPERERSEPPAVPEISQRP